MDENLSQINNKDKWLLKKEEREREDKKRQKARTIRKLSGQVILMLFAAVIVFGAVKYGPAAFTRQTATLSLAVSPGDWTKGAKDARVSIVEYSDFECPACAAYSVVGDQLMKEFGDKINFVYRHFPLNQHKDAKIAAYSAEAAGKQGKFWEMHNVLFAKQTEWTNSPKAKELMEGYAVALGINIEQFKKDRDTKEIADKVQLHLQSGLDAAINHTPTFFLNGKEIPNPKSYDEFKSIIAPL